MGHVLGGKCSSLILTTTLRRELQLPSLADRRGTEILSVRAECEPDPRDHPTRPGTVFQMFPDTCLAGGAGGEEGPLEAPESERQEMCSQWLFGTSVSRRSNGMEGSFSPICPRGSFEHWPSTWSTSQEKGGPGGTQTCANGPSGLGSLEA